MKFVLKKFFRLATPFAKIAKQILFFMQTLWRKYLFTGIPQRGENLIKGSVGDDSSCFETIKKFDTPIMIHIMMVDDVA